MHSKLLNLSSINTLKSLKSSQTTTANPPHSLPMVTPKTGAIPATTLQTIKIVIVLATYPRDATQKMIKTTQ